MQKRIKRLLDVVESEDKLELVMLNNAFVDITNKTKEKSNGGSVKEWRGLKEELTGLLENLEEKYDLNSEPPDTFSSKIAVYRWLIENGWKISQSQFYEHCKEGLLRARKSDGKYTLKSVRKYASLHVKKAETGQKVLAREEKIREEKLEISLERERVGLEKERFELATKQKKFVPRDEFELAIVARAVAFMAHLNHTVQQNVPDWIALVDGDQSSAPELVEAIVRAIEQRMGDFAADAEIDVYLEVD